MRKVHLDRNVLCKVQILTYAIKNLIKGEYFMTDKEALARVKNLDIRDAEPEDYAALYTIIQIVEKHLEKEEV